MVKFNLKLVKYFKVLKAVCTNNLFAFNIKNFKYIYCFEILDV